MWHSSREVGPSNLRRVVVLLAAVAAAITITACGGGAGRSSQVVVRVGAVQIARGAVAHWMRVLAPHHTVPATGGEALRRRALAFLISSQWLIGEAAAEGMPVTAAAVARLLAAKERSFPGGRREFEEYLHAVARTVPDEELEIRVGLAAEAIRGRLAAQETRITAAEVARQYRQHPAEYFVPEERYYEIVENIPSVALARKLVGEVRSGRTLSELGGPESYPRKKSFSSYPGEWPAVIEAVFKARPHVLVGPIRGGPYYFLIEVTRITPGFMQTLAQVRGAIASTLAAEEPRRRLAAFTASWRRRWKARTSCSPGYVVPECRQYSGPDAPAASLPAG